MKKNLGDKRLGTNEQATEKPAADRAESLDFVHATLAESPASGPGPPEAPEGGQPGAEHDENQPGTAVVSVTGSEPGTAVVPVGQEPGTALVHVPKDRRPLRRKREPRKFVAVRIKTSLLAALDDFVAGLQDEDDTMNRTKVIEMALRSYLKRKQAL